MKKNLRKNKKGFTLVEIIVVLLIIGILLAITIPSIMNYVGQAKDAQYIAEARSGYVGAQAIVAKEAAGTTGMTADEKTTLKTALENKITANAVAKELGETDGTSTGTVDEIKCEVSVDAGVKVNGCSIRTKSSGDKWINFTAATDSAEGTSEVSNKATYPKTAEQGQ